MSAPVNLWVEPAWAERYLAERDAIPHRAEGFAVLFELIDAPRRVLDLGTGDGLLLAMVLDRAPEATGVALDFQPEMLRRAHERFAGDARVSIVQHDLDDRLPDLGTFDLVVSSFAIHHVVDERKRVLAREVFERLEPGGLFANLEHVASATAPLHEEFLAAIGKTPAQDDPSNKLAAVEDQLEWLRDVGFADVDCFWKWRELALLAGWRPR
ncbi:MAG TPA: class I SAM-dependent methyltransferase [Acidimicrobiia bacterium]|nr:class I SAM-dependent methyltransferase [Acidimicrobiia bacterium]